MDLSVVIPVKDEAGAIGALIDETAAALAPLGIAFEIVCVDDGSADGGLAEMRARRAREPRLRIVRHAETRGQSAAVHTGVRFARGEWIATLDGDGQNDPGDLPALWALARDAPPEPPTMFCGWRRDRRDGRRRALASRVANAVRARALGDGAPDGACGLKLFPRALFLALPRFDHMHRFLPALAIREGGRAVSVPVRHRERRAGRSKYGAWGRLRAGLVDLLGVMWLKRRGRLPGAAEEGS